MSECLIGPEVFVGHFITVTPKDDDDFNEFSGVVRGVRNGFLQVRDADDDVFEVEVEQVTLENG